MDKCLVKELEKLSKVFFEVSSLWDEASEKENDILCNGYPFETSFDELAFAVIHWVGLVKKELEDE